MALAVLSVETPSWLSGAVAAVRRRPAVCWGLALVPLLLAYPLGPNGEIGGIDDQLLALHLLLPVVVVLFALPAVFDAGRGLPRRVLALRVVAWLGLVSYGLYLWHWGALAALNDWGLDRNQVVLFGAATLALTAACAAFSYYVVERPFLALKDRRASRRAPMAEPATAD